MQNMLLKEREIKNVPLDIKYEDLDKIIAKTEYKNYCDIVKERNIVEEKFDKLKEVDFSYNNQCLSFNIYDLVRIVNDNKMVNLGQKNYPIESEWDIWRKNCKNMSVNQCKKTFINSTLINMVNENVSNKNIDKNELYASEMEDIETKFTNYFGDLGTGDIAEKVKEIFDIFAKYCFDLKNKDKLKIKESDIDERFLDSIYQKYVDFGVNILSKNEISENIKNEINFDSSQEKFYEQNWYDIIENEENNKDNSQNLEDIFAPEI